MADLREKAFLARKAKAEGKRILKKPQQKSIRSLYGWL